MQARHSCVPPKVVKLRFAKYGDRISLRATRRQRRFANSRPRG